MVEKPATETDVPARDAPDPSSAPDTGGRRTDPAGYVNPYSLNNRLGRLLWSAVWVLLFRPSPWFMAGWRRFLLRLFGAKIGKAWVHPGTRIWAPWLLSLGDDVFIDDQVRLYNAHGIRVRDRSMISQNVFLCSVSHDYRYPKYPAIGGEIVVAEDCWICADAFVAPGVTVGRGSVVGARAVVLKDVPEWTVAGGNPARAIKERELREV